VASPFGVRWTRSLGFFHGDLSQICAVLLISPRDDHASPERP